MNGIFKNINKDDLVKIVKFFRGKAHNRITIYAIGTGALVASTPIWLELVGAVLNKEFDLIVVDDLSKWIGFFIIVIALIYNYFMNANVLAHIVSDAVKKKIDHDISILTKIDIQSGYFENIRNRIQSKGAITGTDLKYMFDLEKFFNSIDNQFIVPEVLKASKEFNLHIEEFNGLLREYELQEKSKNMYGIPIPNVFPNVSLDYHLKDFSPDDQIVKSSDLITNEYNKFRTIIREELFI